MFGTFLLVTAGVGGDVAREVTGVSPGRAALAVAPALTVTAIILFMGKVGGAHLNPAVSLAFAMRREFPWAWVPGYVAAQLTGALLACLALWALLGRPGSFGATVPAGPIGNGAALGIETLLTLGLVSTILGTASSSQNVGPLSALAVGSYIALAGLWAGSLTGASMNPVRSAAPDIVRGDLGHTWIFVVGPLLGSLLAVGVAIILRGRGGDAEAEAAATGSG